MSFFNVGNTFFSVFGYQMSYLEFFGTLLNLWSVWLVSRNSVWTWPVGNVAVLLFGILFYQIRLYSDLVEQVYFFVTGFYGWWVWTRLGRSSVSSDAAIAYATIRERSIYTGIIMIGTLLMGFSMGHINEWLPRLFSEPASFPYMDAFTTVMSFAATILMAHKKIESWFLWIVVDVIGIWLYFTKHVVFISLLYCIFLVLAIKGLIYWKKVHKGSVASA